VGAELSATTPKNLEQPAFRPQIAPLSACRKVLVKQEAASPAFDINADQNQKPEEQNTCARQYYASLSS
jgi:hypothetical protein